MHSRATILSFFVLIPEYLPEMLVMWLLSRFYLYHMLKRTHLAFCLWYREGLSVWSWKSRLAGRATALSMAADQPGRTFSDAVGSGSKEVSWRPGTRVGSSSEETSYTTTRTRMRPRLWWEISFSLAQSWQDTSLHKNTRRCAHYIVYTLHILASSFTRKYRDILQVQISCQDPNKRGEERVTCFLPLINLSWMMTCHGSSSNNGDFYPRGHAAGFE